MNLEYLRSFYITVKANSISKAAKMLFLSQPGLSMQLQALEKDLGVSLLIRSNKGVELTKEGEVVFDYASKLLTLQDNIERDLDALKLDQPKLFISSCKSIGDYALPCTLYLYKHNYPNILIDLQIGNSAKVVKDVLSKTATIGIIQSHFDEPNLVFHAITESEITLATGNNTSSPISLEELCNLPLILLEEGSGSRKDLLLKLEHLGILYDDLTVLFEANSSEAIKSAVLSGKGAGFFPKITIQRELERGLLHPITIEDFSLTTKFYIIHRKDHTLTSFEQSFIDLILSEKRGFC